MSSPRLNVRLNIKAPDKDWWKRQINSNVNKGLDALKEEVEKRWQDKARSQLKTSKEEYLNNLTIKRQGNQYYRAITVELTGWLPVAVEQGVDRFDMKPGFLQNRPYRVIPMGPEGNVKFRTVKSSQSSMWWHPGIQARAIGSQIEQEFDDIVKASFTPHMKKVT